MDWASLLEAKHELNIRLIHRINALMYAHLYIK
jgi:hypothetical protein